nr:integrase, catalytic region, zinc finger, CCHC-type, peptidase aspartic, catalytic [Tanacetum cinerariifolium]
MDEELRGRMLMEQRDAQGQSVFTSRVWKQRFEIRGPLVHKLILEFFSAFRDPMLRLCHRLIVCNIVGRSQAPEKVTLADLFYLRGMDVGSVNIPYLLARYLRLFSSRRKHGEMISRERQLVTTTGAPETVEDAPVADEGAPAVLAPVQVVQIILWYLEFGCSKHMTGNRSQLMNFVSRFLGIVRFRNDQIAKIMRYGDYQPTNDSEDLDKLNAKADIGIFVGYAPTKKAFKIYNRRTQKIMETIHVTFDELTTMPSEQFSSRLGLQLVTPATSCSRLVPNTIPQQPCNPPNRDDWDRLFQPMFNEYFNPPTIAVSPVPVAAEPRAVDIAESPVSMSIDLDALSTSIPLTQEQEHYLIIYQGFEESTKTPYIHDDPLHESLHEDSTS